MSATQRAVIKIDRGAATFMKPTPTGDPAKDVDRLGDAMVNMAKRLDTMIKTLKVLVEGQSGTSGGSVTINVITGVTVSGSNVTFQTINITLLGGTSSGGDITPPTTDCS